MSIERSTHAATPHPAGKNVAAGKPPASAGEASADGGASSFLALLAALDPLAADTQLADPGVPDEGNAAATGIQAPPEAVGEVAVDAASLLAQGVAAVLPQRACTDASAPAPLAPQAPVVADTLVAARSAPAPSPARAARDTQEVAMSSAAAAEPAPAPARVPPRRSDAARQGQDPSSVLPTSNSAVRASEPRSVADPAGIDLRVLNPRHATDVAVASSAAAEVGSALKSSGSSRAVDRAGATSFTSGGGAPFAGAWNDQVIAGTGGGTATEPAFSLDANAASPSAALADKLSYWVSKGVQSAEIQLDAFGGGAVDVSISVHGNEAQVEFRSDQPEARRLLQDAMPQLRDMLKGEGLVLSGGFVGTSAQSDPGGQERRNAPPGARSRTVALETLDRASPAVHHRSSGRTVDLFV